MLNAYAAISTYYRVLGETGPALDCLRKATAIAPRDSGFVLAMAAVMLQVRCLDDALQLTNRALEMINKGTCCVGDGIHFYYFSTSQSMYVCHIINQLPISTV